MSESLEMIIFSLSDKFYGLKFENVHEIIEPQEVTRVPKAKDFVMGLINFKGTIISVLDLNNLLCNKAKKKAVSKHNVVVVVVVNGKFFGIGADEVLDINDSTIDSAPVEPADRLASEGSSYIASSVAIGPNERASILKPKEMLTAILNGFVP